MSKYSSSNFDGLELDRFEEKLNLLIQLCDELKAENIALRAHQASLLEERSELLGKNELARSRVQSMLTRLKELEPEV